MNSNQDLLLGCLTSLGLTISVSKAAACNYAFPLIFKYSTFQTSAWTKDVAEVSNNCPCTLCTSLRNGNVDLMPRTTIVFIINENRVMSV